MNTLAKSGHLYELHRKRGSLRIAVDFYERRLRQLRRSIRRQRIVIFFLNLRVLCGLCVRSLPVNGHSKSVSSASSAVES